MYPLLRISPSAFSFSFFLTAALVLHAVFAHGTVYEVGPGKTYEQISQCPTHDLQAGDEIHVYWRQTPYREKFLLYGRGSSDAPIVLKGVCNESGDKPVISGENAVSATGFNMVNEDRQIIKIGQYDTHLADYIVVDGFVFTGANTLVTFTDDSGARADYIRNACAVRPEYADNVFIRNCEIYGCSQGIQNGNGTPQQMAIEYCYIHDNGPDAVESGYQHNLYLSAGGSGSRVIVQFCRIGELLCDGQQLKSRAETTVIRYNWIEGGRNSQIDLVESDQNGDSPAYVYGNVIIKPQDTHNNRLIHIGADSGGTRSGPLYFFHNTCIIKASGGSGRIFAITSDDVNVIADYNIFSRETDAAISVWSEADHISGTRNWLSNGITNTEVFTQSITGEDPGFINASSQLYGLAQNSPCIDAAEGASLPREYGLEYEYTPHLQGRSRDAISGNFDIGAFEWGVTFPRVNSDLSIDLPCAIYMEKGYGFTLLPHTLSSSGSDLCWRLDLSSLTSTAQGATCPQFGPDLSLSVETAFFNGFSYGFKLLFTSLEEPGLHWVLDPGSLVAQ